jgi:cyclase
MLEMRSIPTLLLSENKLVKTIKYSKPQYIGDPVNTAKIFNELEVDELCVLDISATRMNRPPNFDLIKELAEECFMPLAYGGGVNSPEIAAKIFRSGVEKIVLNQALLLNPECVQEIVARFGGQAVIASIDIKRNWRGKYCVYDYRRKVCLDYPLEKLFAEIDRLGVGEIFLTAVDREGTWSGFDTALLKLVSGFIRVPLIAHGGCGSLEDIADIKRQNLASAVGIGSMVVFQAKGMGVLVNYPMSTSAEAFQKNS